MAQTVTERLAANTRAEVARRGLSRRQVARDLGWPVSTLQRRMSGETPFDVDELIALAAYLGVTTAVLIGEEQQGTAA